MTSYASYLIYVQGLDENDIEDHVRIQRGGQRVRTPPPPPHPEIHKNIGILSNIGPDTL